MFPQTTKTDEQLTPTSENNMETTTKWSGDTLEGYPLVTVNEGEDVLAAATQTGQRTVMVRVLGPMQSVALVIGGERVATMRERDNGEAADHVAKALARMAEEHCGEVEVESEPEIDMYCTAVGLSVSEFGPDDGLLLDDLEELKAAVERAMTLARLDGVEVSYVDYDDHLLLIGFETIDAELAEAHDFEEVMRVGPEPNEPTRWNHYGRFWAWAMAKETGPNSEMPAELKELLKDNMSSVDGWIAKKLGVPEGTTIATIAQSAPAVQA